MNTLRKIFIVLGILSGFANAQDPQVNYFNVNFITNIPVFSPNYLDKGITYFNFSEISTLRLDAVVLGNTGGINIMNYYYFRTGHPVLNSGGGNFGSLGNPFLFEQWEPDMENELNGSVFIKLRDAATKKDLVVARENQIQVYWNESEFVPYQNFGNLNAGEIHSGMFDNSDNREDVIIKNINTFRIYKNLGTGYLEYHDPWSFTPSVVKSEFGIRQIDDLASESGYVQNNPDNRADLIISSNDINQPPHYYIYVFLNNNNNTFSGTPMQSTPIDIGFFIDDIEVVDLTNDGLNDIVVVGYSYPNGRVKAYKNIQGLFFAALWDYSTDTYIGTSPMVASNDLNKDGWNDLVFVSYGGKTSAFINKANTPVFGSIPDQYFAYASNWLPLDKPPKQVTIADVYNTGGLALVASYGASSLMGIRVLNSMNYNPGPPPPPPILQGDLLPVYNYYHPWLRLNNRGERDWQKYKIYKSSPSTGHILQFITDCQGDFIDYYEYVYLGGNGPDYNCYYVVKSVDLSSQESIYSNPAYYTVGIPTCDGCDGDNMNNSSQTFDLPNNVQISNFPNPFNPVTKILYALPFDGNIKITVYNSLGEAVKILHNGFKKKGSYAVEFNGSDLSSGIYFYRIEIRNVVLTKKMVLLK